MESITRGVVVATRWLAAVDCPSELLADRRCCGPTENPLRFDETCRDF